MRVKRGFFQVLVVFIFFSISTAKADRVDNVTKTLDATAYISTVVAVYSLLALKDIAPSFSYEETALVASAYTTVGAAFLADVLKPVCSLLLMPSERVDH